MLSTKIYCALITRQGGVACCALLYCNTFTIFTSTKSEVDLISLLLQIIIYPSGPRYHKWGGSVMNKYNNFYGGSVWEYCLCLTLVCSRSSVSRLVTGPRLAHTPAPGSLRFSLTCRYFFCLIIYFYEITPHLDPAVNAGLQVGPRLVKAALSQEQLLLLRPHCTSRGSAQGLPQGVVMLEKIYEWSFEKIFNNVARNQIAKNIW